MSGDKFVKVMLNSPWIWLWLLFGIALDQLTKYLADHQLTYLKPSAVIPGFFDLLLVYNKGAAFSFLSTGGDFTRWLLTAISAIVSVVLIIYLKRTESSRYLLRSALLLILAGAIGNLVDRALIGYVIDFISLYHGEYRFATFNMADAFISVGAILLILDTYYSEVTKEKKADQ
jgi:signal peptidase II